MMVLDDEARSVYIRRGTTISVEHGYLCIRDRDGWLQFDCKVDEMPASGLNLSTVLAQAYDNRKPKNPHTAADERLKEE
jgi:hypothetical protein